MELLSVRYKANYNSKFVNNFSLFLKVAFISRSNTPYHLIIDLHHFIADPLLPLYAV